MPRTGVIWTMPPAFKQWSTLKERTKQKRRSRKLRKSTNKRRKERERTLKITATSVEDAIIATTATIARKSFANGARMSVKDTIKTLTLMTAPSRTRSSMSAMTWKKR
ncbi:predicted protein [Chaetoceros tenuissimus]|uniref:Uncharacterized protein n=1 Tax=Chaetoceros tenuissimus TaxID=426638 RepID=A0AAD3HB36_9STRA|nr:predicted protein [Chaetoceros tenuissimus]